MNSATDGSFNSSASVNCNPEKISSSVSSSKYPNYYVAQEVTAVSSGLRAEDNSTRDINNTMQVTSVRTTATAGPSGFRSSTYANIKRSDGGM